VEPIFKRLVKSLNDQLNETAIAAEARLDQAGIPVRFGDSWALHEDMLCKALWSQRHIAEKTLANLREHQDGVGSVQWITLTEPSVPFSWV
jgi:hypothetical protein